MPESLQPLIGWLQSTAGGLLQPWTLYQLGIVVLLYLLARIITAWLEPLLENRVRQVHGKPGLMRVLVALLRNTRWFVLLMLLLITWAVMQQLTWPSRSYLVGLGARLVLAWVVINVLSRVIRNRTLSRLVAYSCWILVALGLTGQLDPVVRSLDSVAFSVGEFRLSLLKVIKGLLLVFALLWLAISAGKFIDRQLNTVDDLTPSLKVLIGKIVRILLVVVALLVALSSIGIDLTALTIFSGAVGVGIGFGLQKVVANFISGIIILLDKSIKPGDTITLGDTFGWIRELRARFVSVVTRDGREYLIPNEDFITQQVVNWSFTDKLVRLDVPFGVSYESDPHEVSRLAIEACAGVERVSDSKRPVCWMTEFGDSSLNFLLRFWIDDPENGLTNIRGKVLLALWDTFKANEVGIPFPHRELIFRNPLPLAGQPPDDNDDTENTQPR